MCFSENIITIINAGLSVYLVTFFFRIFSNLKYNRLISFIAFALATLAMTLVLIFVSNLVFKMVLIISISILLSFLYELRWFNRILLPCIMYALSGAAEFLTVILLSVLFSAGVEQYTFGWLFVLGIFLSKVTIILTLSLIKIQKHKILHESYHKKYLSVCCIPISTFAVFLIMYRYYITNESVVTNPDWVDLLCCLLLVIANIVSFNIIDSIYNAAETSAKLTLVNSILDTKEEQYKELMSHNNTILKIKHDHKNFLLGILSDVDSGKLDNVRSLISKELDIIQNQDIPPVDCNIIHTVVNYKLQQAKEHNIIIEHEYHEIQKINIAATDLAIILGNALDNAIEASKKLPLEIDKLISLYIKVHGDHVIIIIKNPIQEIVDTEKLLSNKNSIYHGFGIMSMKNIAAQYGGNIVFNVKDNTFETHIILNN